MKNDEQGRQIINIDEFYDLIEYEDVDEEYIEAVNDFFGKIVEGMEEDELDEKFLYIEILKTFYLEKNEQINFLRNNHFKIMNKIENLEKISENKKILSIRIKSIEKYFELLSNNRNFIKNNKLELKKPKEKFYNYIKSYNISND